MANYYGSSRTNYLRVKDEAAFCAFAEKNRFRVVKKDDLFALFSEDGDGGELEVTDEQQDEKTPLDEVLPSFLADDSIAIIQHVGREGLRYLNGYAIAVNSKGEKVQLSLEDIYEKATEAFGIEPSRAAY